MLSGWFCKKAGQLCQSECLKQAKNFIYANFRKKTATSRDVNHNRDVDNASA